MKEFITNLKVLERGLSPTSTGGSTYLERCVGMRLTENGLEPFDLSENESLKAPDGSNLTVEDLYTDYGIDVQNQDTEFLQIGDEVFLSTKDRLYSVSTGRLQLITMYDVNLKENVSTFPLGSRWSIIDTENYRLFINGRTSIYYDKGMNKYYIDNTKTIQTGSFYEGRVLLGGFVDEYFYNSVWREFYKGKGTKQIPDFDESTVFWSSVGGNDISWYFFPDLIFNTTYEYEDRYQLFLDLLHREAFGSFRIPEIGAIVYMKQLGQYLAIYGTKGIALTTFIVDPVQSLSVVKIIPTNALSANCIAGNVDKHMFMDNIGSLWLMTQAELKYLDFKYLFEIKKYRYEINYLELLDEFYITSDLKTYIYNRGMTETKDSIIACAVVQNKPIYLKKEISYE